MVINNPQECGLDHKAVSQILKRLSLEYYCMADEIATTGTYHTHIFLYSPSPIRFSTLKSRFPIAHIEKAYGSIQQNRNYILKSGKWENSDKADTTVKDTFTEWGNPPDRKRGKSPTNVQANP